MDASRRASLSWKRSTRNRRFTFTNGRGLRASRERRPLTENGSFWDFATPAMPEILDLRPLAQSVLKEGFIGKYLMNQVGRRADSQAENIGRATDRLRPFALAE